MDFLALNVAAFAVAFTYCIYRTHQRLATKRRKQLSQRVAYMLWVMAERSPSEEAAIPG